MPDAKICGITTPEALDAAIEGGARFVGFVTYPKSPRFLTMDKLAALAARARGRVETVLVTVNADDAHIAAAKAAGIKHFIYVSVAHPAPMMKDYIAVRTEVESLILSSEMNATILRPWYVLGPGHRWPYVLIPAYWLAERIPATREAARRLGLVRLGQMLTALVTAAASQPQGIRIVEVPAIRAA